MEHKFQLVLQIPEDHANAELDLEDDLAHAVGNPNDDPSAPHLVDGNSYGGGTIEFFIHTNDPRGALELAKPLLVARDLLPVATAAFRHFSVEGYIVIWPKDFTGTFTPY